MTKQRSFKVRQNEHSQDALSAKNTVDEWNKTHPIGTRVQMHSADGRATLSTSAPAMVLAGTTPVIWLKGVYNPVPLNNVAAC